MTQKLEEKNNVLIKLFEQSLVKSNLGEKTVRKHVWSAALFINDYLLWEDITPEDGYKELYDFLGDWAIRKGVISSEQSLKLYASSLRKFYKFLFDQGMIDATALKTTNETIKNEMPDWIKCFRDYEEQMDEHDEYF